MSKINRRAAVTLALASGATIASPSAASAGNADSIQEDDAPTKDQRYIMAAGFTRAEADCWKNVAEAAAAFFALPELHQLDNSEVATAIHVIQNKLLSRPTYRKYLELAKAGHQAEQQKEKE